MQDEIALLNRARALDEEALAQIHDTYYAAIHRYLAIRVNDQQTAEDLTSEVFIRFLHALRNRNAPQNTIRGWLYGAASLILKEHYRKKAQIKHTMLDESLPSPQSGPAQHIEKVFFRRELQEALDELTEDQRDVIALRFGYEMPIKEVAQILNKSIGSIKQLQARGIAALSHKLSGSRVS